MIVGVNRVFPHAGRDYHIQVEDLGEEQGSFEVRIYDGGTILWRKKVGYQDVLAKGLPRLEQDEELRSLMEKTLHTVQAAIAKGKLDLS
jgi:hypothetical protein